MAAANAAPTKPRAMNTAVHIPPPYRLHPAAVQPGVRCRGRQYRHGGTMRTALIAILLLAAPASAQNASGQMRVAPSAEWCKANPQAADCNSPTPVERQRTPYCWRGGCRQ